MADVGFKDTAPKPQDAEKKDAGSSTAMQQLRAEHFQEDVSGSSATTLQPPAKQKAKDVGSSSTTQQPPVEQTAKDIGSNSTTQQQPPAEQKAKDLVGSSSTTQQPPAIGRTSSGILRPDLVQKLQQANVVFEAEVPTPLDLPSGEKHVFAATRDNEQVVVLHSRTKRAGGWAWNYSKELEVLRKLQDGDSCGHIIQMYDFFEETPGHGPCMVMEAVTPIGWDIFLVCTQYALIKEKMPKHEKQNYLQQIVCAVVYMHNKDLIHCDLKGENVVVGGPPDFPAKLIDFGYCRERGQKLGTNRVHYQPLEHAANGVAAAPLDMWGIGHIFWQMHNCFSLIDCSSPQFKQRWLGPLMELWKIPGEHEKALLCGLLALNPEDRWTLDKLTGPCEERPAFMTHCESPEGGGAHKHVCCKKMSRQSTFSETPHHHASHSVSIRYCRFTYPLTCFGLRAHDHQLVDKFFGPGPHDPGGEQTLSLKKGVILAYVHRGKAHSILQPKPFDRILVGDWVYFLSDSEAASNEMGVHCHNCLRDLVLKECGDTSHELEHVQFFPEFDQFELPDNCAGGVLGPAESAASGQKALDLLGRFGINLVCIKRPGQTFGPSQLVPNFVVEAEDVAVVCRAADAATGQSNRLITVEVIEALAQTEFEAQP